MEKGLKMMLLALMAILVIFLTRSLILDMTVQKNVEKSHISTEDYEAAVAFESAETERYEDGKFNSSNYVFYTSDDGGVYACDDSCMQYGAITSQLGAWSFTSEKEVARALFENYMIMPNAQLSTTGKVTPAGEIPKDTSTVAFYEIRNVRKVWSFGKSYYKTETAYPGDVIGLTTKPSSEDDEDIEDEDDDFEDDLSIVKFKEIFTVPKTNDKKNVKQCTVKVYEENPTFKYDLYRREYGSEEWYKYGTYKYKSKELKVPYPTYVYEE